MPYIDTVCVNSTDYALRDTALTGSVADLTDRVADLEYEPIAVGSFDTVPSSAKTAELGSTVNSLTVAWRFNKEPDYMWVNGSAVTATKEGQETILLDASTDTDIVLRGMDSGSPSHDAATVSKTITLHFCNRICYGTAAMPGSVDSAFINGLTNKVLSDTKARTFTVNAAAGQYIWYAVPARLGACSFNVGGFDGGFEAAQTVSVTNASNYTEDYYVYRSTNPSLGSTTVKVS